MTNTLYFTIGDETRPKVENLFKIKDETFFFEVYEKAFNLIAEILEQNQNDKNSDKYHDDLLIQERNNIIAFVGDRGTGKTSCMKTVYNVLKHNKDEVNYQKLEKLHSRINKYSIVTLPTIDPSYFEERHNFLDIVIAHMFEKFQEVVKNNKVNSLDGRTELSINRQVLIKNFKNVKTCLDTIKQKPNMSNDTIESLSEMANGINLKNAIREFINCYLDFFGGDILAIAIDDIDLQIKYAYDMVEQMRKYLLLPNVVILMGVKMSQLNDIVKQYYYQETKDLIATNRLTDTTENMAGRYLSKLIPFNHRIFIPSIGDNFDKSIIVYKDKDNNDELLRGTISSVILNLIFIKTRYLFYYANNNPSLIIPRNLRDLLNLLSLLIYMDDIPHSDESSNMYNKDIIINKNRGRFRNYFINTWCCENLSAEMFAFIKELESIEVSNINKRVVDFLMQLISIEGRLDNNPSGEIDLDPFITNKWNRSYNVSLGDVDYVLDKLSNNYGIPYITKFIFAMKTIYSFFLYKTFEEQKDDVEERVKYWQMLFNFFDRKDGIDLKKHLRKMTKMMIIPSYEKLLGGNLIRVANVKYAFGDYNKGNNNDDVKAVNNNENRIFFHQKKINNLSFKELNTHILNKNKEHKGISWESSFNIWEFFILTAYLNTDNIHYRRNKTCFYFNNPNNFPLDCDLPIIYSSTAILFNIVKLYHNYKLFKKLNELLTNIKYSDELNNIKIELKKYSWYKFWTIIEGNKTKSMIHKLICASMDETYANPELEKIFIRNIEVLDTLEDYLPYLKKNVHIKPEDKNDYDKAIKIYTDFYRKLEKFQFQLYPKDIVKMNEDPHSPKSILFKKLNVISVFLETLNKDSELRNKQDAVVNTTDNIYDKINVNAMTGIPLADINEVLNSIYTANVDVKKIFDKVINAQSLNNIKKQIERLNNVKKGLINLNRNDKEDFIKDINDTMNCYSSFISFMETVNSTEINESISKRKIFCDIMFPELKP